MTTKSTRQSTPRAASGPFADVGQQHASKTMMDATIVQQRDPHLRATGNLHAAENILAGYKISTTTPPEDLPISY
jgi:hypothetical protein